jgi:hypothetical protein
MLIIWDGNSNLEPCLDASFQVSLAVSIQIVVLYSIVKWISVFMRNMLSSFRVHENGVRIQLGYMGTAYGRWPLRWRWSPVWVNRNSEAELQQHHSRHSLKANLSV